MPDRKMRRSHNRERRMAGVEILREPATAALVMSRGDDLEPFYLDNAELVLENAPWRHEYRDDGR